MMKHIKKALSLTLALLLAASLAVPALAAKGEPLRPIKVYVNVNEESGLGDYPATLRLRNWEWGEWTLNEDGSIDRQSGRTVSLGEPRDFEMPHLCPLNLGQSLEINNITHYSDVNLYAWSDPDGDGVYDQRIDHCVCTPGTDADGNYTLIPTITLLPASESGPFTEYGVDHDWYYASWSPLEGDNGLTNYNASGISLNVWLSAGYLTRLFGPDTLVELEVRTGYDPDTLSYTYGYYHFYLTGEKADPATLDNEHTVSVTDGGALVSLWAADSINAAEKCGIVPDGLFGLDLTKQMTRAQFAAFTDLEKRRPYQEPWYADYGVDPFTLHSAHPYREYIERACALGFVKGVSDTEFNPDGILTREEAAVMLSRVYEKLYGPIPSAAAAGFTDDSRIHAWARDAVAFMSGREIVNGVGNGSFAPRRTLTAQEALSMAQRMLEKLG